VADELLGDAALFLVTARNLLKKIPDPAGCLFSSIREFFDFVRHAHYEDADKFLSVQDALEAFEEQEFAFIWRPSDDRYLEHDYALTREAHADAVDYFNQCLTRLERCRVPDWLEKDGDIDGLLWELRPLVRRLRRTRDLFTARAIVLLIEREVKPVREGIEIDWPRDDEIEDAIQKDLDEAHDQLYDRASAETNDH
jgi:hypothetical protein